MTTQQMMVAGRKFRTKADYEAALRDEKKIQQIKAHTNLNDQKQVFQLYSELQSGVYRFETAVGTDFDDEIYETVERLKEKGANQDSATKHSRRTKKSASPKAEKQKNSKQIRPVDTVVDKELEKQIQLELHKREKRRKWIVILSSVVAVGCFAYFGVYYFMYARTSMDYAELSDLKGKPSKIKIQNEAVVHKTGELVMDILPEYETLYEKNKKLIGWIKIDDTNIDYPVMQTSDNDYYLDHNFNQEYDKNGCIFLDKDCSVLPRSTNLIIYGHHMKSGKMFGSLQKYAKESYYEDHKIIQFDTIYEKGTYEIMYAFRSQVYNEDDLVFRYYRFINANSSAEFDASMAEMKELALYDTGVTAAYGDSLITLSTCDSSQTDGRFVIVAKKILT